MYTTLLRPLLFRFQPETAHAITFGLLKLAQRLPLVPALVRALYRYQNPKLRRTVFGIDFPNPVGLAAGLDKDAEAFDMLGYLGFGFVEIGTLTPVGQPGNPQPRAFRLTADQGLINRMGFNNQGVEAAVQRLRKKRSNVIVGGNIGKNKVTPNEEAGADYARSFEALFPYVDYFVVNVSSPNTPNLRALQDKEPLTDLLLGLKKLNAQKPQPKPILLKIAPDLSNEQLDDIVDIVQQTQIDGVVATNTTIGRQGLKTPAATVEAIGAGGLSGRPVRERSTEVIRYLHRRSGGAFPIVGVGGIHSPADAIEKLEAGASLVQLYTGFIYEGPSLIRRINQHIAQL